MVAPVLFVVYCLLSGAFVGAKWGFGKVGFYLAIFNGFLGFVLASIGIL